MFIGQIKLVATYAEMTLYMTMKAFINEEPSHGVMLPGVAKEVKAFLEVENNLKVEHGEGNYPYLKALKLRGQRRPCTC